MKKVSTQNTASTGGHDCWGRMPSLDDYLLVTLRRSFFVIFTVGVVLGFLVWQVGPEEEDGDDDGIDEDDDLWEGAEVSTIAPDHRPIQAPGPVREPSRSGIEAGERREPPPAHPLHRYKGHKCTIAGNDLVLRRKKKRNGQYRRFELIHENAEGLMEMCRFFEMLFLIVQVGDGKGERGADDPDLRREIDDVKNLLWESGLLMSSRSQHAVLFCETHEGVRHMVRALKPSVHVDGDADRIEILQKHVPAVVFVEDGFDLVSRRPVPQSNDIVFAGSLNLGLEA